METSADLELAPRETQILHLAGQGLVDKEIAAELGIAMGTVRTYWGRMRSKLGVSTRAEAIAVHLEAESLQAVADREDQIEALQQEVSRRRRAEAELEATKENFKRIVENLPDVIFRCDLSGRIMYVCPQVEVLFGVTPESLIDKRLCELPLPPQDLDRLEAAVRQVYQSRKPQTVSLGTNLAGDAADIEYRFVPEFAPGNRLVSALASCRDMTEQLEMASLFRALFDHAPQCLAQIDVEGRVIRANLRLARALGREPDDLVGDPIDHVSRDIATRYPRTSEPKSSGNSVAGAATVFSAPNESGNGDLRFAVIEM